MERVRDDLARGKCESATERLQEDMGSETDVHYLLEAGLVHHYCGNYERSNNLFDAAELRMEDLYTKSVSKEAFSLLTSDNILPYGGEAHERVLVAYYRALNYIFLGFPDDALVECRKANHFLEVLSAEREGKNAYSDDAFVQYLTGILYEWQGEWDNALISYRRAWSAYSKYEDLFGVPPPAELGRDYYRSALRVGHQGDLDKVDSYCPKCPEPRLIPATYGDVVILAESGFAPFKIEHSINIPILKGEGSKYADDPVKFAPILVDRASGAYVTGREIDYFLRVAIPGYPQLGAPDAAEVVIGNEVIPTYLVEDVGEIAKTALSDRMPVILLKTVARGFAKYLAHQEAEKRGGKAIGWLANIAFAASEQADTRSWTTLPRSIRLARLHLVPGVHDLTVRVFDHKGNLLDEALFENIIVRADDVTFIHYRSYQ